MTAPKITYRPIPGLSGYRAASDGRIQSCWSRGRYSRKCAEYHDLEPAEHHGRPVVRIKRRREGARVQYRVAELVLLAFQGPAPDSKPHPWCVNEDQWDCRPENLRWSGVPQLERWR